MLARTPGLRAAAAQAAAWHAGKAHGPGFQVAAPAAALHPPQPRTRVLERHQDTVVLLEEGGVVKIGGEGHRLVVLQAAKVQGGRGGGGGGAGNGVTWNDSAAVAGRKANAHAQGCLP